MTTKNFIQLLDNKSSVVNIDLQQFDTIIENFPYFQSARMLYLKNLKTNNNFQFNSYLKETAAYVGDRTVLFEYITDEYSEVNSNETPKTSEPTEEPSDYQSSPEEEINTIDEQSISETPQNTDKKQTEDNEIPSDIHKTLSFKKDDKFSFNEWLQLSNIREIHRAIDEKIAVKSEFSNKNPQIDTGRKTKFDLIDKFIDSKPKLRPASKDDGHSGNIALSSIKENEGWMTETLAQVYIEQKKYSKAIKAYRILGLKYPEKSGFFADQIRSIKKMTDH